MKLLFLKRNKKYSILIILAILSIAYIYSTITSHITNPLNPTITPKPVEKLAPDNPVINNLRTPDITLDPNISLSIYPQTLNVYTTSLVSQNDLRSQSAVLVNYFKLSPAPSQNIIWQSADKSQLLYLDYPGHSIQYSYNPPLNTHSNRPTTEPSITTVKQFLSSIPEYSQYSIMKSKIEFYKNQAESQNYEPSTSALGADYISIPATLTIDNFPFRDSADTTPPLVFLLGQNNTIVKIIYNPQPVPKYSNPKKYSLLTLAQIEADLKADKASITNAPINAIPNDLQNLPPITIENISLEYRYDHQKSLLIPYFFLSGVYYLKTADTPESIIQFILPAVHL